MRMESFSQPKDNEEVCHACGGPVQRRPFGEMHAGSFILDGERVEIRRTPNAQYADPIVLDAITQYFDGGLYRAWPSERYLSRGGKKLHRAAWTLAFGPIPDGCHIHHRDDNPLNNKLANLECMPASAHLSHTWHKSGRATLEPGKHFTAGARQKAAEWHGSDAGRLWHSRNAVRSKSWTKWKRSPRNCPECNTEFNALIRKSGNAQIYCTSVCKAAAYRRRSKIERAAGRVVSDSAE